MSKPKLFYFLAVTAGLFLSLRSSAQSEPAKTITGISTIHLAIEIKPVISTAFIKKNEDPATVYSSLRFQPGTIHNGPIPNAFVVKKALVRFSLINNADTNSSVYFFPGFYCRSIRLFRVQGTNLIPLPDIMPDIPQQLGYRLISMLPRDSMTVVAELGFVKTYINKIRPRLVNPEYLPAFVFTVQSINSESDLSTYIFSGLLLMMILYSLANYFQGSNREFLYYSVYAFLLGSMLFTKAVYNYHTDQVGFFLEEYLDFILQSLGIIFYMIFMQRFLNTKKQYRFLHHLYNAGILLLSFSIIAYTWLHYTTDNFPLENGVENITKILLLLMVIIFLAYSLGQWKDKLLRYLFWGNLFFLLFSFISLGLIIAPGLFNLTGLAGNSLVYYEAGLFFELVFFLAGLNYKNRRMIIEQTRETESLKALNLLKEYEKEMAVYKAQQEERERISADMHDELGSGMTAIRLMSEIARNKMKENTPQEIEKISQSADDVLNKMNAIIWSMSSSDDTLDSLVLYIRSYVIEYFENTAVECIVHAPETILPGELNGEKRRNVFLCVKETLNNVLKHSGASQVTIDITVNRKLVIRIADNGKGIDLENLRRFGNGLKNISKRMQSIGGHFTLENQEGTVTTLELKL